MENVNEGIRAAEVRAVFPDGTVEVMRKARLMGLDVVLVAPTAIPPVAKAMDYALWLDEKDRNGRRDI